MLKRLFKYSNFLEIFSVVKTRMQLAYKNSRVVARLNFLIVNVKMYVEFCLVKFFVSW